MRALPVAAEGWPFILGAAAFFLLFALLGVAWVALPALLLTAFVAWFFRDPERDLPEGEDLLVSPADGKVIEVRPQSDGRVKIGIFLSIFDVHVNRLPLSGEITDVQYRRGSFLAAWKTIASDENERCGITIRHPRGAVRAVQVAGLVARRIICRVRVGEKVRRGERYGLIRFGSRLDTYLPPDVEPLVRVGERVRGGASVIGRWR
jgi:phosphatidylserine decarboxylase